MTNPLLYEVHIEQGGKKRASVNAYYDEDIAVAFAESSKRPTKLYSVREDFDENENIIETEIRLRTYSNGAIMGDQSYEKVRTKMEPGMTEAAVGDAYAAEMGKKSKKPAPTAEEVAAKEAAKAEKAAAKEAKAAERAAAKEARAAAKAARGESRKRLFPPTAIIHVIADSHGARAGSNRDGRYSQITEGMTVAEYAALVKKGKAGRDLNNLIAKGYLTVEGSDVAPDPVTA